MAQEMIREKGTIGPEDELDVPATDFEIKI
jgi:hypothetical protein